MDQLTKLLAEKHLMTWENKEDISYYSGKRYPLTSFGTKDLNRPEKNFYVSFAFNYVRNQGAAWGTFSTLDERIRKPLFHLITIFASLLIFLYWRATPPSHRLTRFSLALVFSGAVGNFIDRFLKGYVVDFLDVSWSFPLPFSLGLLKTVNGVSYWAYEFPKFNWADSCITVGAVLLLIDMLFFEKKRALKEKQASLQA